MTTWEPIVSNALGSAGAGIFSRILTHPLDTVKARLQADGQIYRGPFDAFKHTYHLEGFRGLYRGFSTVIVGGTPGTILYLCSYDIFKERIAALSRRPGDDTIHEESFLLHFASGLLAEAVACIVYVPVDVIKERLQVQDVRGGDIQYKGGADAFVKIWRAEGPLGYYRGYAATLMSFGPFSALYFVFYEQLKSFSVHISGSQFLPMPFLIGSSAFAGALASFLTSPLDLAKLRLQVQRGQGSSGSNKLTAYRGVTDCLLQAYYHGGLRGLFRGAGARVLHFVPATTVTMTSYETARQFFHKAIMENR